MAVALLAGVAAGSLVGFLLIPAPTPAPPTVVVPLTPPAPSVPIDRDTLSNVVLASGRMLVSTVGQIHSVEPDGTGGQAIISGASASAAVGPATDGSLVVLDNGGVETFGKGARPRHLTAATFTAGGLAGRANGRRVLACGGPTPRGADAKPGPDSRASGLLLPRNGGAATRLQLGCPVAWAAGADRVAGAGGPWSRFRDQYRGHSVLAGPAGGPLATVIGADRVLAAGGGDATVGAVALSPDGRWLAAAVGAPKGAWTVLVEPLAGGRGMRIPLASGYQADWIGWRPGQGRSVLTVAALDRRGDLGGRKPADRAGDGYVLSFDLADRSSRVLLSGLPLVRADGFAWSADGQSFGVSSPGGWTVVLDLGSRSVTPSPVTGTLVSWPGGDR